MKDVNYIVVLGGGESGVGAAVLAVVKGYKVFVSDSGSINDLYKNDLIKYNVDFEENRHSEQKIMNADLIIKSPGIPDKAPLIQKLKDKGVPMIDELEFACQFTQARIIAVTGSNGKTTTARLIHHILNHSGMNVGLAGNIGFSFAKQVALSNKDFFVLEVSSFQLDYISGFNPDVAVLLNITPDHLDRYDNKMENYIASKFRIVQNMSENQAFIYNADDENIKQGFDAFYKGDKVDLLGLSIVDLLQESEIFSVPYTDFSMNRNDLALNGRHNLFNMQCAVLAAKQLDVENNLIGEALRSFENDAHRLEKVININNIEYINDSKATNVDAVFYALESMKKNIVWIVGGVDKGNDYSQLFSLVKEKVRAIVCLGIDNSKIFEAFREVHEIILEARSVNEAVKIASLYAEPGDVVLLSPACASFDLFENYKDRGDRFKAVLLQQHKMMTEGIEVEMNFKFKINPVDNNSDD
jgi:UDP-N-acetylmuramoylalanine--D-glutamate ligase